MVFSGPYIHCLRWFRGVGRWAFLIPVLQMRKPRLREVMWLTQSPWPVRSMEELGAPPPLSPESECIFNSLSSDCSEHSPREPASRTRQAEGAASCWLEPAMGRLHGLFLFIQGKEEHDEIPSDQRIAEGWGGRGASLQSSLLFCERIHCNVLQTGSPPGQRFSRWGGDEGDPPGEGHIQAWDQYSNCLGNFSNYMLRRNTHTPTFSEFWC